MSQKPFDTPEKFAEGIDHLVNNIVVSIARDLEANYFSGMNEEQVVQTIYGKYGGLFVPHGCIEMPKRKYKELHADRETLIDEDARLARRSVMEHRRVWFFRTLTTATLAIIAVLVAWAAKVLGIELPIKVF